MSSKFSLLDQGQDLTLKVKAGTALAALAGWHPHHAGRRLDGGWIAGGSRTWHYNGSAWSEWDREDMPRLHGFWGVGGKAWAVGSEGWMLSR